MFSSTAISVHGLGAHVDIRRSRHGGSAYAVLRPILVDPGMPLISRVLRAAEIWIDDTLCRAA
jgi:hypothetical protein